LAGAFSIVMEERKALVDKIITMMKRDGGFFHNASEWDRAALRPQNPLSKVWYRGGNRMKLMAVVTERGYRDPRWCTAKQLFEKGYRIKTGEHGIICEKWIFEKEKKTKNQHGNIVKEKVQPDRPQVMYFRVFNGEQVEDFPEFVPQAMPENETELGKMIDQIIDTSECPIIVEEAARILGVAKSSMYEVIRKNNIHHVFVGRRILLPKKNFHDWLEKALYEPGKSLTR